MSKNDLEYLKKPFFKKTPLYLKNPFFLKKPILAKFSTKQKTSKNKVAKSRGKKLRGEKWFLALFPPKLKKRAFWLWTPFDASKGPWTALRT